MNLIAENQLDIKVQEGVYMGVTYDDIFFKPPGQIYLPDICPHFE
jgi:hypothetical protein